MVKKISKRKKQVVALRKQTSSNKGDLAALRHDSSSSDQRKIGMLSI